MSPEDRAQAIETQYAPLTQNIFVLSLTDETLKMVMVLRDGSTLRVAERWQRGRLIRYSYYWLTEHDRLRVGWDNAPHHTQVDSFPHHKHLGDQGTIASSSETSLEEVMAAIEDMLAE